MTPQRIARSFIVAVTFVALAAGLAAQGRGGQPEQAAAERYAQVVAGAAQGRGARGGGIAASPGTDPMVGPVVRDAPYSADAVTTVTQVLGDGTRIEQRTTARFYRDSAGRVRREQTIIGLTAEPQTTITIAPDPGDGLAYALDADARTARRVPRGGEGLTVFWMTRDGAQAAAGGLGTADRGVRLWTQASGAGLAPPQPGVRPTEQSLGTRQIEGVKATGRRSTTTIPTGQIGNDRPIEITDERWESPELRLLVLSRHHDPRTGDVEYQLTNINRSEPPSDLFQVPSDYTIVGAGGGRGARSGGARGGRGAEPGR